MSVHPKRSRLDYGEQLIPPSGYELTRAVGTTYSLDLEALMVLPVALFHSRTLDGDPEELRFELLDAITKSAGKIDVFCQKGHISVPKKYHHLMAYWEKGVHEILPNTYVKSFHPKVWVIRYESPEKPVSYRVLVMSRNLTQSRDWDLALTSEGEVGKEELPGNEPLVHFLRYLNSLEKGRFPEGFIRDVGKVAFDCPEHFQKMGFQPSGFAWPDKDSRYENSITKQKWERLLIVSPFLDGKTLATLKRNTERTCHLFSRREELDAIPEEILAGFDCWQFSDLVEKGELREDMSEGEQEAKLQSLHAKLFVGMKNGRTTWYLGSANCSEPAQGRNVEFMMELRGADTKGIRTKDVVESLTLNEEKQEQGLFERYRPGVKTESDGSRALDQQIRKIRHDIASLPILGRAEKFPIGTAYGLTLEIDARRLALPPGFEVRVRPIGETHKAPIPIIPSTQNTITEFSGYEETLLSPFLEISILNENSTAVRFLRSMEIVLPESRLTRIFNSIIDSQEKFLKYLAFLLTGEEGGAIFDEGTGHTSAPKKETDGSASDVGVFERLMVAASRNPQRLESVEQLVQRLEAESIEDSQPILSSDFKKLWDVFRTYRSGMQ